MKNSNSVKLIDGVFEAADAKEILLSLINFKINFHQRRIFSLEERFGTIEEASLKRIEELKKAKEQILEWTNEAEAAGQQLIINSHAMIEVVENSQKEVAMEEAEVSVA
ncbi:MAG: hypothetical protein R2825_20410 [Saprospiraceae bacterium]|jgi:hypothetical protein